MTAAPSNTGVNSYLLAEALTRFVHGKSAFVDAGMAQGMDPAMMAQGGGMPPGMAPGMDPSMMGGQMPPAMDPAMMAGQAPPEMDPAMMGGQMPAGASAAAMTPAATPSAGAAPADPSAGAPPAGSPLTEDRVRQLIQEAAGQGQAEAKPKKVDPAAAMAQMERQMHQIKHLLANMTKQMGMQIDVDALLEPPSSQEAAPATGGQPAAQSSEKAAGYGYSGRGVYDVPNTSNLRNTLSPQTVATKAAGIHRILTAQKANS